MRFSLGGLSIGIRCGWRYVDFTTVRRDWLSISHCDSIEQRPTNRHRDSVFARALVLVVGRALTGCRDAVFDSDEILVLGWIRVTAVSNDDSIG